VAASFRIEATRLRQNLRALGERGGLSRDLAGALFAQGQRLLIESLQQVPVDTGALRASGSVSLPEATGDRLTVTVSYGGAAKDYAVPQHERLDYQHTVGKAKYLEEPFLALRDSIEAALGTAVEAAITKHVQRRGRTSLVTRRL
jgi:hypothetical protein